MTARFIGLVGHRSSGERGSGPIRPTVALPKPRVAILHQRLSGLDHKCRFCNPTQTGRAGTIQSEPMGSRVWVGSASLSW